MHKKNRHHQNSASHKFPLMPREAVFSDIFLKAKKISDKRRDNMVLLAKESLENVLTVVFNHADALM